MGKKQKHGKKCHNEKGGVFGCPELEEMDFGVRVVDTKSEFADVLIPLIDMMNAMADENNRLKNITNPACEKTIACMRGEINRLNSVIVSQNKEIVGLKSDSNYYKMMWENAEKRSSRLFDEVVELKTKVSHISGCLDKALRYIGWFTYAVPLFFRIRFAKKLNDIEEFWNKSLKYMILT